MGIGKSYSGGLGIEDLRPQQIIVEDRCAKEVADETTHLEECSVPSEVDALNCEAYRAYILQQCGFKPLPERIRDYLKARESGRSE